MLTFKNVLFMAATTLLLTQVAHTAPADEFPFSCPGGENLGQLDHASLIEGGMLGQETTLSCYYTTERGRAVWSIQYSSICTFHDGSKECHNAPCDGSCISSKKTK